MLSRQMLKSMTQPLQNPPFNGCTLLSPKHFVLVCIILLTANLYVLASHVNIQSLKSAWPIYSPSIPVSNQGFRTGSSGLEERKFLTSFVVGLFFQCFGIHVTWKHVKMNHYNIHRWASVYHINESNLPLSGLYLLERSNKGDIPSHWAVCSKPCWVSGSSACETAQRQMLQEI